VPHTRSYIFIKPPFATNYILNILEKKGLPLAEGKGPEGQRKCLPLAFLQAHIKQLALGF